MTDDRGDQLRARTAARAGHGTDSSAARTGERRFVRSLRVAISLVTVLAYVLLFGAAVGAAWPVVEIATWSVGVDLMDRVLLFGVLLLPAATFLFVALYDDADLTVPEWSGPHPPLVDAWLFVVAAGGGVTVAFGTSEWPRVATLAGLVVPLVMAYVVLPFWLARRCLRRPSWALGSLTMLASPLVLVVGALSLDVAWIHGGGLRLALSVAAVGTAVPYWLAYISPGPGPLAERLATALRRAGELLAAVSARRGSE